jgi:putative ABC transport system ATP-binding protein
MKPLISLKELTKEYNGKVRALDQVSIEVRQGEWVAVTGASGSGKTTLLNMIAALDRPTSGSLWVDEIDLLSLEEEKRARFRREKVGLIFQQFHLIPYLTALENVMLAQYFHSMTDKGEAAEALRQVGLGERMDFLPSELSGGEQQMVAIGRALMARPRLVQEEEHSLGLAPLVIRGIFRVIQDLRVQGITLLLVEQNAKAAFKIADRGYVLEAGGSLCEARSDEEVKRAYLGASPILAAEYRV